MLVLIRCTIGDERLPQAVDDFVGSLHSLKCVEQNDACSNKRTDLFSLSGLF